MNGSGRKVTYFQLPGGDEIKLPNQVELKEKKNVATNIINAIQSHSKPTDLSELLSILDCKDYDNDVSADNLKDWQEMLETLKTSTESAAQELLRANWICATENTEDKYCMAISTDSTNLNIPCFKYTGNEGITPVSSGKCDVSSMVMPMGLEIKSDTTEHLYQVIAQMFERVHMTAIMGEHLCRIVHFCSTGSDSWMLVLERTIEEVTSGSSCLRENYKLIPINGEDILHCWRAVTSRAMKDPRYFAHPDAFILQDALASVGLPMSHCRVKLQKISTSRIYYVHEPILTPNLMVTIVADPSLAIKVNCTDRAQNERKILQQLKDCSAADYSLGTLFYGRLSGKGTALLPKMEVINPVIRHNWSILASRECWPENNPEYGAFQLFDCTVLHSRSLHDKIALNFATALGEKKPKISKSNASKIRSGEVKLWWHFSRANIDLSSYTALIMIKGTPLLELTKEEYEPYVQQWRQQLDIIHQAGVLHTDLRPSNIMIDRYNMKGYIIDYDLSSIMDKNQTCAVNMVNNEGARYELMKMCTSNIEKWRPELDDTMFSVALATLHTTPIDHSKRSLF